MVYCLQYLYTFVFRLVLVSTLDGKVSALDASGVISWQIDTGPGPLLTSNIHQLEVGFLFNSKMHILTFENIAVDE